MQKNKILLVEDDPKVCSFINKGLTEEGFDVSVAFSGESGLELFNPESFNLVILDIMLPNINGLEVCKEIRKIHTNIPILFLTALGSAENIVLGLSTGADDYLVKPFKFIELIARIKNLLKRSNNFNSEKRSKYIYTFLDVELNDEYKTVKRDDYDLSLTSTEYKLLLIFLKNPRKVLTRMKLLEQVWGVDFDMGTNVVDVYVNYLRKKLEKNGGKRIIQTFIGMGYMLKESDEDKD
tara:strand:- start:27025 stop:27735 length:711 start_codon:yes stop_codon:yes gene_type:complete